MPFDLTTPVALELDQDKYRILGFTGDRATGIVTIRYAKLDSNNKILQRGSYEWLAYDGGFVAPMTQAIWKDFRDVMYTALQNANVITEAGTLSGNVD